MIHGHLALDEKPDGGATFAEYEQEINSGRPVMIQVEGHSMVGVGYNDADSTVYLHDTWDYNTHSMKWGGKYAGMQHYCVTMYHLAPSLPPFIGRSTAADFNFDSTNVGSHSASQSWGVDGSNLVDNIVIMSTIKFEVSLNNVSFGHMIILEQTSGTVPPTTIYSLMPQSRREAARIRTRHHEWERTIRK